LYRRSEDKLKIITIIILYEFGSDTSEENQQEQVRQ
jgi:hypothetical protein